MDIKQKKELVENLKEQASHAKSIVFVNFSSGGLLGRDLDRLRTALYEAGGQMRVVKNSSLRRVFESQIDADTWFEGPTAIVFANDDMLAPLKILKDKDLPYNEVVLKGGIFEGQLIEAGSLEELAMIPNRDVLLAQFASQLVSPLSSFITTMRSSLQQLVLLFDNLANQSD